MGSSGSKYVIAFGFVLIFFSLFFNTWKTASAPNKQAYLQMKNHQLTVMGQEPLAPRSQKVEFPKEVAFAGKLGISEEDFKKNLGTAYNDAKKKFEEEGAIKEWNELCDKAKKGDWEKYKDWVNNMGHYYRTSYFELRKNSNDYAREIRNLDNEVREEAAQVNEWRWIFAFIMYFGVFLTTVGFIMLSLHGEGNEKLGALVGLAAILFFITNYWGAIV